MKISIGPITKYPSWNWIGEDTAKELSKYFSVRKFDSFDSIPQCNVVIVIKQIPTIKTVNKFNTIYCPVDIFNKEKDICDNMPILRRCKLVLCHSRRLLTLIPKSKEINHHLKFKTKTINEYKKQGYILWSGGYASTPFLFKFLDSHKLPYKVKVLANYDNPAEVKIAKIHASKIGTKLNRKDIELEIWSEKRQNEVLLEAKAAIDIKGESFNQQHKPPTKTQKYICAGLPVALNKNSESYEYALSQKLNVPTPENIEYWLSEEYYEEIKKVAKNLRKELSLESVGLKFKDYINVSINPKFDLHI